ncbi:MAG: hypothetical protein UZ12_BCD005000754 [Bacteroidetes bacterium OLB12]|nr:MAG: hypothetical protein UZ12_BCD005000754 [Bacteroidetes bacterium OLB12]
MPLVFLFEPTKLLLGLGKLKVVQIIQRLAYLNLHGNIRNEDNSGVFLNSGGLAGR